MSEESDLFAEPQNDSPPWNRNTKMIVAVIFLLLVALLAYRFQSLIAQLIIAAIIAYILSPIINFLDARTAVRRNVIILGAYAFLAVAVIGAFISLGVAAFAQVNNLITQAPELITNAVNTAREFTTSSREFVFGPFVFNPSDIPWSTITEQVVSLIQPTLTTGGQMVGQVAASTVELVGNLLFIFILSIYIAIDIPRLGGYIADIAQLPGYREDAERLMNDFGYIMSAYLRGQVILGLVIGIFVWLGLTFVGVQNSLALGIIAGLLEFIPIVGPVISAGVAMTVAFFQPTNYLALPGWEYALVVLAIMFVIQQAESNFLVPRIVGESLDIHPLIVMLSVFMGGSLAGILGAILAAPIAATVRMVGVYAARKMFDMPPFPEKTEKKRERPLPRGWRERFRIWFQHIAEQESSK